MCGIVGFSGPTRPDLLSEMNLIQAHRGPDDSGFFVDNESEVSMAMRRLSILDITGGHQPMLSDDRSICLVFNGEIFNAPELRKELERSGVVFRTNNSDSEVVLRLYEIFGSNMLHRLNGMFALAILDLRKKIIFAARDRTGIKPLYYSLAGNRLSFASELKSLTVLPWIPKRLNADALSDFLTFQCIPGPSSIYRDIQKLPPGSYLEFDLHSRALEIHNYWRLAPQGVLGFESDTLPAQLRLQLETSLDRWLLSDVPIGFSLSGGVDSSALVALAATTSPIKLKTYTLGFSDYPGLDETHEARLISEQYGTDHTELVVRADDLLAELPRMVYHLDEPYAGGLPSWFVFKAMAEESKVAITGTGGDELFGNYGKWLPFVSARSFAVKILENSRQPGSLSNYLQFPKTFLYHAYMRQAEKTKIFSPSFRDQIRRFSETSVEAVLGNKKSIAIQDLVAQLDFQIQLPDEFLLMTDRFSMAHSLEARTPFLDSELVDFVYSIPHNQRTSPAGLKNLLKNAVRDLLPEEILSGRKRGFVLPYSDWLRRDLAPDVSRLLGPKFLNDQGIFSPYVWEKLALPFLRGENSLSPKIWTLLMLQYWLESQPDLELSP